MNRPLDSLIKSENDRIFKEVQNSSRRIVVIFP